jgi:hypothetical protein
MIKGGRFGEGNAKGRLIHLVPALLLIVLACLLPVYSQQTPPGSSLLAPTPPMGWNSWDSYARTITERDVKANADWMARHLEMYGWQYVVIDEGWYLQNPEARQPSEGFRFALSADGRYKPVVDRFPSSVNDAGFKPLADYLHSLGLKFGIHIIRGIPREAVAANLPIAGSHYHAADAADITETCPWNSYNYGVKNTDAGQAYYDSIAVLYASWRVDFLKVDCIAAHPYRPDEIRMISLAIKKTGRPIVLSLSPGPTALDKADEVSHYAQMWRISNDIWDHWGPWQGYEWSQGLLAQFATAAQWAPHAGPGGWPDADMLPLGYLGPHPGEGEPRVTRFTPDEQRTLMTLWCVFRSPLIMGGNLTSSDASTTALLTNPEVLAVDQHSTDNHPVITTEKVAVWMARPQSGKGSYVAVFNLSDGETTARYAWKDLGIEDATHPIRDLWERKDMSAAKDLEVTLAPHASALYRIEPEK